MLLIAAFAYGSPIEIAQGMKTIVFSRDALITDYFELAGYGAAFFNAAGADGNLALCQVAQVAYEQIYLYGKNHAYNLLCIRYALGEIPAQLLKKPEKCAGSGYPTRLPISPTERSVLINSCCAF